MPVIMLVDNGSTQAEAVRGLRRLAAELGRHTGHTIHPVSLQHAGAIPPEALDGIPASTFTEFVQAQLDEGESEFIVLPLFFGESKAITAFIPDELAKLRTYYPLINLRVARVTYPLPDGDRRMAAIVRDHIEASRRQLDSEARVVLVDHGSPTPRISEVRKRIALSVERDYGLALDQACMERREGRQYDFNGPLLQQWLRQQAEAGVTSAIIAMLFFLPGRHAGPGGDVASICDTVVEDYPQLRYTVTPLISEHPLLLEILADRLRAVSK